jgi:hypothetical protein
MRQLEDTLGGLASSGSSVDICLDTTELGTQRTR